jgi:hypothetical protein
MSDGNQPYLLSREEGPSGWFLGTLMTVKATDQTTSNGFGLIECFLPPGFAPPLHILEGSITTSRRRAPLKQKSGERRKQWQTLNAS